MVSPQVTFPYNSLVSDALLPTKLYKPPLRPSLVPRPRLIEKLNEGLGAGEAGFAGKVSLVSAPPGFGKTTLVSEWLDQLPESVETAWLSLEPSDNDPARFFAYLTGALQTVEPELGRYLEAPVQIPPPDVAAEMLLRDLADISRPLILVLDDHHVISTPAINRAVAFMVERLPPLMHLVVIGRADPSFSLSRLRVRRQLTEIRAQDLRFNLEEAAEFLNLSMGLRLSADEVALLESRTEGWAAGLQLAAHSLQLGGDKEAFLNSFAGDDRYVADYLMEEVLAQQPEEVRSFLFETSILERLCGRLCDAVLGRHDGQAKLEFLEQANLFIIPLDNRRMWYRYHHLFGELLRERSGLATEASSQLHRRASQWYAENGLVSEAIEHALSAGDLERSVALIIDSVHEMFRDSRLMTLLGWWQRLPERITAENPKLGMMAAWAYLATGQSDEAERCLQRIETAMGYQVVALLGDIEVLNPYVRNGLIEVAAIRMTIQAIAQIDANQTLALCQRILPFLTVEEERHLFNPMIALRPVALFNSGLAHEALGHLEEAADTFRQTIDLGNTLGNTHIVAGATGHLAEIQILQGKLRQAAETCRRGIESVVALAGSESPLSGLLHVKLGQLSYEWNQLEQSVQHLQDGIELARRWRNREAMLPGYLGLVRAHRALDQEGEAQRAESSLERLLSETAVPSEAPSRAHYAWHRASQGDTAAAERWLRAVELRPEDAEAREEEAMVLMRLRLLEGDTAEARGWLEPMLGAAETGERWGRVVELLALAAVVEEGMGNRETALGPLSRALQLAEGQGYVRLFVDLGRPMAGLLRHAVARNVAPQYATRLLAAFPAGDQEALERDADGMRDAQPVAESGVLPEPLSQREAEVLQLIAGGLTNKEIAARLHLAPGTVKVHAHNLYSKLGVGGRTQAVARARALNLLR